MTSNHDLICLNQSDEEIRGLDGSQITALVSKPVELITGRGH